MGSLGENNRQNEESGIPQEDIGDLFAALIRQGHTHSEIMEYHPGLFAVYVRAAKRHQLSKNKELLSSHVLLAHTIRASTLYKNEGFKDYTMALEKEAGADSNRKKKKISSNEVRDNWLKFGRALGAL